VRPHTYDFNRLEIIKDLVDESMLDIDPPGTSAGQIANQSLIWGRSAIRVLSENGEEALCLWLQTGMREPLGVLLGLFCVN
jgi:hypothetical protein